MKSKVLSNSYLSPFCLELSMLLRSGVWPADAVLMLKDDEKDADGRAVLQSLLDALQSGSNLSEAFNGSGFFPEYMVNMAGLGERTGRLADTLEALSGHYDRQDKLAQSLRNALMYPSLLFIMMAAAVLILVLQVLPIFNDVFGMMGAQMSPLAAGLMAFGNFLSGASVFIAAAVCAAGLAALAVYFLPGMRNRVAARFKDFWGGTGLYARIAALRFTSAMSLAIKSGLAVEDAVGLASGVSGGVKAVNKRNENCMELIKSGKPLAAAMSDAGILSARESRMLSVGSRSGRTDDAIEEIARRKDAEVQNHIARLVGRIEPTMVIITSIIVGMILVSVMLPLINIMTSIG